MDNGIHTCSRCIGKKIFKAEGRQEAENPSHLNCWSFLWSGGGGGGWFCFVFKSLNKEFSSPALELVCLKKYKLLIGPQLLYNMP